MPTDNQQVAKAVHDELTHGDKAAFGAAMARAVDRFGFRVVGGWNERTLRNWMEDNWEQFNGAPGKGGTGDGTVYVPLVALGADLNVVRVKNPDNVPLSYERDADGNEVTGHETPADLGVTFEFTVADGELAIVNALHSSFDAFSTGNADGYSTFTTTPYLEVFDGSDWMTAGPGPTLFGRQFNWSGEDFENHWSSYIQSSTISGDSTPDRPMLGPGQYRVRIEGVGTYEGDALAGAQVVAQIVVSSELTPAATP